MGKIANSREMNEIAIDLLHIILLSNYFKVNKAEYLEYIKYLENDCSYIENTKFPHF